MTQIKFDYEKCIGCKICYKACFIDVIRWNEKENKPFAAYNEDCVSCMYCFANCPKECITIETDWDSMRDWSAMPGDERQVQK
ncbi:MAG: 4Fe-4S binding protein [Parasporobacterium sp.]|nr:4Fe-4S binding protein [Parasporobacterium sp.]